MFEKNEAKAVKRPKKTSTGILWVEAAAFSTLIGLSWLTEALRLPQALFGEQFNPNYHRAALRSIIILMIWSWVYLVTRRLLKRLHHLEEFLRVCGWCRKVCDQNEWMDMERFFNSKFDTKTTHGMCPDCLKKKVGEMNAKQPLPSPQR